MTIWCAIFFGAVQGITEFLPVSSSGHLVLLNQLFGLDADFVFFSVLLHLATLFAVVVVLWKEIRFLVLHPFSAQSKMLFIATIPTVIIVLVFKGFFEGAFGGGLLPICFCLTALLLSFTQLFAKKSTGKMTLKKSFWVGVMQGVAVLPGISRSGATISLAVLLGVDKQRASRFSFLLSLPIILASMAYELFGALILGNNILDVAVLPTVCAFLTAFLVGVVCIKFMLKTFQKISLLWFALYLVMMAVVSLFALA